MTSPAAPPPEEWRITDTDGVRRASGPLEVVMTGPGRLFMRNAIKRGAENRHERWLVAELSGVRIYIQNGNILITHQDLYP